MTKRTAAKASGPTHGLDVIILEVLGKVASPDACASLIDRALKRAKLGKMPEDPVVLLAFASGALREAAGQDFGEEMAEELLGDVRPILERAAEHAVAMEQAAERAAANESKARTAKSEPSAAATKVGKAKRKTWPHGQAAPAADKTARTPTGASPKTGAKDPRRSTLSYQATADEFADGSPDGKITVVVVDRDEALRTTLARMLRREGLAVVTAPDAELGLTLCVRVTAQVVVFDAAVGELGARLRQRLGERAPHTVAMVSGSKPPDVAPVADRVLTKPLGPEQLLAALEGLLPEARPR
jgi:CheY-like chemotaxis protein